MNTYKLTATALKNGKTLYQVINENGDVISKRTSTRKYVACTIDGSYYFGRLDLIGKGDHGKVLANIQDCKVNTLEKYEAEVKRNIREIRWANKAHLDCYRRHSTQEQLDRPISQDQRDLLIQFYGQEVADSVHTQWEYQVATCNDEYDIRKMMQRIGDYETWKKNREEWVASREPSVQVAYLAN